MAEASTSSSDRSALPLYLAMLAGRDRTGFLEVRYRKTPGGAMGRCFIRSDRRHATAEVITGLESRTDVFVGCAPRSHRHGGVAAVDAVYCLWVDLDGPEAVAAMDRFSPTPTLVLRSGTGPNSHAYWQLTRPLTAADAQRAMRRLAHRLGADMACTDAARILRPPGTRNFKTDPPGRVVCEHLDVTAYDPRDLVGDLADPPEKPRASSAASGGLRNADGDALMRIPSSAYIPELTGREANSAGYVQCPRHNGGEERTPSLMTWDDPDRGWMCFGTCQAGGTIIDFASLLWAIEPRGAGYHEIRERLETELGVGAAG